MLMTEAIIKIHAKHNATGCARNELVFNKNWTTLN